MNERRHVDELDGDPFCDRRRRAVRRGQERKHRPEALPARRERVGPDVGHEAGMARHRFGQACLDCLEIVAQTGRRTHVLERRAHRASGRVQGDDRASEEAEPDSAEPGRLDRRRELFGPGKAPHARREIGVGLAAGQHAPERRHDAVEPERRRTAAAGRAAA